MADVIFREATRPLGDPLDTRPRSAFQTNMLTKTLHLLRREGDHLGTERVVVEVDGPVRQDGMPAVLKLRSPVIRVFIDSRHGPLRYDVGTYNRWEDNLRGVALALEALRAVDRYGVTAHGEQYAGWKALPPGQVALGSGSNMSEEVARKVIAEELGEELPEHASQMLTEMLVRKAKSQAHPDRHNGDRSRWNAVEEAGRVLLGEEPSDG